MSTPAKRRPPTRPKIKRLRVTEAEFEKWEAVAERNGLDFSKLVRWALDTVIDMNERGWLTIGGQPSQPPAIGDAVDSFIETAVLEYIRKRRDPQPD